MKKRIIFLLSFIILAIDCNELTIGFMGDVMLGREVNKIISKMGYEYVWGDLLNVLRQNDFNIINLEMALTKSNNKRIKVFNFKAHPNRVNVLKKGHITIANIANNHILDYGDQGLIETLNTLRKNNILFVGAGKNINDARKPVIIKKNEIKIGILGATDNEPTWKATRKSPGTNFITVNNFENLKEDILKLRPLVDILILTIHWGPNMQQRPSKEFVNFAHNIIDLGVDIFHGHSSHVFQAVERYKNKLIMYDTGDFIDDYAVDEKLRNDQSFLFNVTVNKKGIKKVELIPVVISNMQVNKAKGQEKAEIINKMKLLSKEFNTDILNGKLVYNFLTP